MRRLLEDISKKPTDDVHRFVPYHHDKDEKIPDENEYPTILNEEGLIDVNIFTDTLMKDLK